MTIDASKGSMPSEVHASELGSSHSLMAAEVMKQPRMSEVAAHAIQSSIRWR